MRAVFFSLAAATDLREIHDYIFAENATAADRLLEEIQSSCESLGRHPRLGVARDDLLPGIRLIVVRQTYVVFYRIRDEEIEVYASSTVAGTSRNSLINQNAQPRLPRCVCRGDSQRT